MDFYGQEPEAGLLGAFVSRLEHKVVIDVGAERGAFVERMLNAGSDAVHAIEPEPRNAAALRERYRDNRLVTLHECAVSDSDGQLRLHISVSPEGAPVTFGHTVIDRPDTDEIAWRETVTVRARSLASLVEAGEIPARVGILKIDTEGNDLAVIAGMGALDSDVVMVEHWSDLPHSLGPCPWSTDEMLLALRARGFSDFAFIVHRGEFVILQWNNGSVPTGAMGNLVFLHDRVAEHLLPAVLECASSLAERAADLAEVQARAARERLAVIEQLASERELLARERNGLAKAHISQVEDALREANRNQAHGLAGRARAWTKPRIGMLRQYQPKPLLVPANYLLTTPPEPAPTISIVTPSFEQGRFLDRTLYSVVSQRYPALEYVVQDGGSSDETPDVIRRYEPSLTRWVSEPDEGQADAINRGFRHTTGEIMAWLNSDDLLLPGSLAYVARYFSEHPNVDVVYGNRLMIDEQDGQIGAWILPAHDDTVLTYADYVPQETLFWRRRLWDAVGGSVDPSFNYALDWDLLLRFRDAGATMARLPRFLGAFRIHDEQKTTATAEVGAVECARLRERVHGREISHAEMRRRMRPYFLRHILIHKRQRIVDRLPLRRHLVRTVPDDSWLTAQGLQARSPKLQSPGNPDAGVGSLRAPRGDA